MIVDFHVHSTASDGTLAPEEIVASARSRGFFALAITDHDNVDAFACGNPGAIAGIELSVEPGEGFDKFHLLGIGIDPVNSGLAMFLKRVIDGRNARNRRMLENFSRIGIEIDPADISAYAHGDVLARPHFAQWLAKHGYASDVKSAFDRYLLPDSPGETRCYEERWHPSQEAAFEAIHRAGGLCVMAHPKHWRREWRFAGPDYGVAERELMRLKEAGLDGLEALYQANSVEENVNFVRLADRAGLLKTAGSDFHGANKPFISLGMEVEESYISPFLAALNLV
ncbi:MAG: PHP domain-containing protein [Kiritimatiellae bacterium]|nr:PHP domain-containing protein [Kiritimatiellia bacterium]